LEGHAPEQRDFARVWQKAEQIVFSRTLTRAPARTARVEPEFDPEAIRKLKRESPHDIFIGGAELAARALESDLVDECHLFVHPVIVAAESRDFEPPFDTIRIARHATLRHRSNPLALSHRGAVRP
jgi:dihydrofolate reductase